MISIANSSIIHAPYGSTTTSPDEILSRGLELFHELHVNDGKKNRIQSFCERKELDLNKYICDESFSQCNDLVMADGSRINLASPSHRLVGEVQSGLTPCSTNVREQEASFSQTSNLVQQDADSTCNESECKSNGQCDRIEMSPGMPRNSDHHPRNHNLLDIPSPSNVTHSDVVIQESSNLNVKYDIEISNVSYGTTDGDICSSRCMARKKNYLIEKTKLFKLEMI